MCRILSTRGSDAFSVFLVQRNGEFIVETEEQGLAVLLVTGFQVPVRVDALLIEAEREKIREKNAERVLRDLRHLRKGETRRHRSRG